MNTPVLVDAFATGFQKTRIYRLSPDTFVWDRRPGADRSTAMEAPDPATGRLLTSLAPSTVQLSLPVAKNGGMHYTAPAAVSVAMLLWADVSPTAHTRLAAALEGTGGLLRLIHTRTPPLDGRTGPSGPARLSSWMDSGAGPRSAATLHRDLRRKLGERRWTTVRDWCEELTLRRSCDVLLHGAPSTGSLIPGPQGDDGVLLTGEDINRGSATFDIGWLLGEFLELRMTAQHHGAAKPWLAELPRALMAGYGPAGSDTAIGRAAVLRVMTHAHDFSAYVGWHSELDVYGASLPRYIDSDGQAAVDGSA
ncbi:hypothetical protein [Streptomyces decoyicus]|uniref:hypothetical protein n=1 Tax=Streptomyces decoyicus TaxID=249567 RepID=UPI00386E3C3D